MKKARLTYEGRLSGEPATTVLLEVGTRVYNHGDMANIAHFGTITRVQVSRWGTDYEITPDADSDRTKPYRIPTVMFSDEYKGNGLTRFVTEEAYNRYREGQMARFRTSFLRSRGLAE